MTGLTDVRDRTLTMLRALGVEPDPKQMRTVEKYVRWVDGQISTAHIDGRVMDREVARGHEMTVTHDPRMGGAEYTVTCHEREGAGCRLVCEQGCDEWPTVRRDEHGPFHLVNDYPADEPVQHRMTDNGQCLVVDWLRNDDAGIADLGPGGYGFEIARFPVRVSWTGDGYRWEKA